MAGASSPSPHLAQPQRRGPGRLSRAHEYEGPFPQHPARGPSGTSMSVIVPDMPTPLGTAPGSTAHRHDRRRDYFTDSTTLGAAMGRSAPTDAGIRYNIGERSSAASADSVPASATRALSPTIRHVDAKVAPARKARLPLFRRAEGPALPSTSSHPGYGPDSRLPRFMRAHQQSADEPACASSRASSGSGQSLGTTPLARSNSTSAMQSMLEVEETRLLEAERKSQLRAVDSILTDEQKIAYVGVVYLILVDMQNRLNVQYKESQSSTASFMNFSRRLMRTMYAHIRLSAEEQRMIELLPRHKVTVADMAQSLAAQGDTILVEADQDLAILHAQDGDELVDALQNSAECRSSTESARGSAFAWLRGRKLQGGSGSASGDDNDIYSQYSMLPTEGLDGDQGAPDVDPWADEAPARRESSGEPSSAGSPGRLEPTPTTAAAAGIDAEHGCGEGDMSLTKVDAEQTLAIDVCATLVLDMYLLLLSDDVYDSRGRYLLRCLADALRYPWIEAMRCERRVTRQLRLHDYAANLTQATQSAAGYAVRSRAQKGKARRM
ncbi:hypothetical protein H4R19_003595, partial [Coemansia spiralis]